MVDAGFRGTSSWETLLNPRRLGNREPKNELGRSPFNSDHDKIIFSGAFRRLAKKTQVHPHAKNDHIHNRLTHSLEVACVGRSLGVNVGYLLKDKNSLPDNFPPTNIGDIVQAACLAHDIGNPPFGHTGEEAIKYWFQNDGAEYLKGLTLEQEADLKQFEGNAQGLRVLTASEYYPNEGGMRLTYATLASFVKYPWTSVSPRKSMRPKEKKFGVFQSELKIFEEISEAVGLNKRVGGDWYYRHPLVYLMEAADDFCYGLIDLEDGLQMGILSWDQIYEILRPVIGKKDCKLFDKDLCRVSDGRKPSIVRGKIIERCVESATSAFGKYESEIIEGKHLDLISLCDSEIKGYVTSAKRLAEETIFNHRRKVELELGAYNCISTLLDSLCGSVCEIVEKGDIKSTSFRAQRVAALLGKETLFSNVLESDLADKKYFALMRVIDFVSGMTDQYASYLAKQLSGTAT
jgi:dGTPase